MTIQNAVEHKHLGVATSSAQLFRQMGGTIGVSLMGGIMSARMDSRISSISQPFASLKEQELAQQIGDPKLLLNPEQIARLKAQVPAPLTDTFARLIDALREALLFSLKGVFFTGVVMMVIAVIVSLFLKEIPLRTSNREPSDGKTENAGVQKGPLAQKPEMQRH